MKKQDPSIKIIGCGCGRLGREGIGLDSIMIHDVAGYIDYISPHYYQMLDRYGNEGWKNMGVIWINYPLGLPSLRILL